MLAFWFIWAIIFRSDMWILAGIQRFLIIAGIWQKDLEEKKEGIKNRLEEKRAKIVQSALRKYLEKILLPCLFWLIKSADLLLGPSNI